MNINGKAVFDDLLVVADTEEKKHGSIIIATEDKSTDMMRGLVIDHGPGRTTENGEWITPIAKTGDVILFDRRKVDEVPWQLLASSDESVKQDVPDGKVYRMPSHAVRLIIPRP